MSPGPLSPLGERLLAALRAEPRHFAELVEAHGDTGWRDFLRAWGEVRDLDVLARDDEGRYLVEWGASKGPPSPPGRSSRPG